jgi:hypothetical protein
MLLMLGLAGGEPRTDATHATGTGAASLGDEKRSTSSTALPIPLLTPASSRADLLLHDEKGRLLLESRPARRFGGGGGRRGVARAVLVVACAGCLATGYRLVVTYP